MLSDEAIMEYQELFKKEYGKSLSYEEARDQGEQLVGLVKVVLGKSERNYPNGGITSTISNIRKDKKRRF